MIGLVRKPISLGFLGNPCMIWKQLVGSLMHFLNVETYAANFKEHMLVLIFVFKLIYLGKMSVIQAFEFYKYRFSRLVYLSLVRIKPS